MEKLMTVREVADLTSLARSSIYAMAGRKEIPHIKLGARIVFNPTEIQAWIDRRSRPEEPA